MRRSAVRSRLAPPPLVATEWALLLFVATRAGRVFIALVLQVVLIEFVCGRDARPDLRIRKLPLYPAEIRDRIEICCVSEGDENFVSFPSPPSRRRFVAKKLSRVGLARGGGLPGLGLLRAFPRDRCGLACVVRARRTMTRRFAIYGAVFLSAWKTSSEKSCSTEASWTRLPTRAAYSERMALASAITRALNASTLMTPLRAKSIMRAATISRSLISPSMWRACRPPAPLTWRRWPQARMRPDRQDRLVLASWAPGRPLKAK